MKFPSSSEGEAAAATTAFRLAGAEGPTTGAGCPAANATTKSDPDPTVRILLSEKVLNCSQIVF
jgi:hypothetical protein